MKHVAPVGAMAVMFLGLEVAAASGKTLIYLLADQSSQHSAHLFRIESKRGQQAEALTPRL